MRSGEDELPVFSVLVYHALQIAQQVRSPLNLVEDDPILILREQGLGILEGNLTRFRILEGNVFVVAQGCLSQRGLASLSRPENSHYRELVKLPQELFAHWQLCRARRFVVRHWVSA